ncbi:MAG: ABC transporter ATP-binding protein [Woeseiaceae bacterium]|nr:ABC transporter ATP-binding protein [Woeseiaceae bacterium]
MPRLPDALPPGRYRLFAGVVVLGIVQAMTLIGMAVVMQGLLATLIDKQALPANSLPIVASLCALAIVGGACRWLERAGGERLGHRHVHDVRMGLFDALASRAGPSVDKNFGIHMVRFSNDLTALRQWVALGFSRSVSAALFLAGVLIALYILDPRLAALLGISLGLAGMGLLLLGVGFEKSVRTTRRHRGLLANTVSEVLRNVHHLEHFGRTRRERRRLEHASEELGRSLERRALWLGGLRGFVDVTHRLMLLVIIVYGASAVLNGSLDTSALLAATGVVSLAAAPLRDLSRVFEYWKSAQVAREKLAPAFRHSPFAGNVVRLPQGSGLLHLQKLALRTGAAALSATVQPGTRVAVTGPNGSGKTALINAIAGLGDPVAGHVTLDGVRTDRLRESHRRRDIGIASQGIPLMKGSISKNVRYRKPGASDAEVAEACSAAGLDELLDRLPEGLKKRLGPDGGGLSVGEGARVKLARALLGNPRLLLLDEIEQGLDAAGREALLRCIGQYPGTIVFATHDADLADAADLAWRLGADARDALLSHRA